MPTTPIPQVNVNVLIDAIEIQKREKEAREKKAVRAQSIPDTFEETSEVGIASQAEAPSPTGDTRKETRDTHKNLKESRSNLVHTTLDGAKELGLKITVKDLEGSQLEEHVLEVLSGLEEKILELEEKEGNSPRVAGLKKQRDEIYRAREDYLAAKSAVEEAASPTATVQSASAGEGSGNFTSTEREDSFWKKLEGIGFVSDASVPEERDLDKIWEKIDVKKAELANLSSKINEKKSTIKNLEDSLRTASTPEEKERIHQQIKTVKAELQGLVDQQQSLKRVIVQAISYAEQIQKIQVAGALGLNPDEQEEKRSRTVSAASVEPEKESRETQSSSSASEEPSTAPFVGTASAGGGDSGSAGLVASGSTGVVTAANDFSGTTFSIASVGNNLRSDAKKTDKIIKRLLAAIKSGNWEAFKVAMIFINKQASTNLKAMGFQLVKAMQFYEKSQAELSGALKNLDAKSPDYNAKLANINLQINSYSQNRMAIGNFVRDMFTTVEEATNLTSSIISADHRIATAASRAG